MGHSITTARMHYDREKPQRDAQRAFNGMAALRESIKAKMPPIGLPRIENEDVGVDVGGEGEVEMEDVELMLLRRSRGWRRRWSLTLRSK